MSAGVWIASIVYWILAGAALGLALLSLPGDRARAAYAAFRLNQSNEDLPLVSVIVPVKGPDEGLDANLAALGSLDYPDYELIVVAQSAADIPPVVLPPRAKVVLAHSAESESSEKVRNLIAAIRSARRESTVLVFADSDGRPSPQWLRALVAPLSEPGVGASTGYRWFLPPSGGLWPLLRGVWDAVAAGRLGPGDNPFVWGGATAIRRETFFHLRVNESWARALSDDYTLAEVVHAAGLAIAFAPGALTPCVESRVTARGFFSWARRQLAITRVYAPRLWKLALVGHVVYCAAMLAAMAAAAAGRHRWLAVPAVQVFIGMWKAWRRTAIARAALPEYRRWFWRYSWIHALASPLATWLWLGTLISSASVRELRWRGRVYPLRKP